MTDTSNSARYARYVAEAAVHDGDVRLKAQDDGVVRKHGGRKEGAGFDKTGAAFLETVKDLPVTHFGSPQAKAQFEQDAHEIIGKAKKLTAGQVKELHKRLPAAASSDQERFTPTGDEEAELLAFIYNGSTDVESAQQDKDTLMGSRDEKFDLARAIMDDNNIPRGQKHDELVRRLNVISMPMNVEVAANYGANTTQTERYALTKYTSSGFNTINGPIINDKAGVSGDSPETLGKARKAVKLVDQALYALPGLPLHDEQGNRAVFRRGVGTPVDGKNGFAERHKPGQVVTFGHPLSTTREAHANTWVGISDVELRIYGNGFGRDLGGLAVGGEYEVLFPGDQKFLVRSVQKGQRRGDRDVYVLEALDARGHIPPAALEPPAAATS